MVTSGYVRISGYTCEQCGVMHHDTDKDGLFGEHYAENHPPPRILTEEETKEVMDALRDKGITFDTT